MKKVLSLLVLVCFSISLVNAQNAKATTEYNGKLLFVKTIPTNPYTVVGKAKSSQSKNATDAAGTDPTGLKSATIAIDKAIAKETKGKQAAFDAVIIHSPIKMELIKFNSGQLSQNAGCSVFTKDYKKKCGTKDIFFLSRPVKEYDVVKVIEVKNFTGLGQMKMGKDEIDNFCNKLYERSCKEGEDGVDFDGIILLDDNTAVTSYLESKSIQLIKYK
jgi:hypothetical protein